MSDEKNYSKHYEKIKNPKINQIVNWPIYQPYLHEKKLIQSKYPPLDKMERHQWQAYFHEIVELTSSSESFRKTLSELHNRNNFI